MVEIKRRLITRQFLAIGGMVFVTLALGVILASNVTRATDNVVIDDISGTLATSCTIQGGETWTANLTSGQATDVGESNFIVSCNNADGYGVYAIGTSDDTEGNTDMISSVGSAYDIETGLATGDASSWAMKVTPGTGITSVNSFNEYHVVPSSWTKVAQRASGIDMGSSAAITAYYRVYVATDQAAGTYTGKVSYTVAAPSTKECPDGYEMSGGVCGNANLK